MLSRHFSAALVCLAVLLPSGCGDSPTGPDVAQVQAVSITAPHTYISVGETVQLVVAVIDQQGALASGHSVTWTSSRPSVATVSAGGLVRGVAGGSATIRASVAGNTASVEITVSPPECEAASAAFTIAVGQTRSGQLLASDCHMWGVPSQGWRLSLSAPTRLQIDLTSAHFDPVLIVTDLQMNVVAWDDDGGEGLNSRVVWEAPAGTHILWARSYWTGETGSYQLTVEEVEGASCSDLLGELAPGDEATGELSMASCILEGGRFADPWSLRVDEPTRVQVELTSPDFSPWLILTDPSGNWIAESGWGGANDQPRLFLDLEAGEYIIWATNDYWWPGFGAYRLSVQALEGASCAEAVGTVAPGASVSGELTPASCVLEAGWFADPWELHLETPSRVQIDLMSSQFDAFLILTDTAGTLIAWDDDGGVGLNSRLVRDLGEGSYIVWATTYGQWETGIYDLSVQALQGALALAEPGAPGPAPELPIREALKGTGGREPPARHEPVLSTEMPPNLARKSPT
jgi:hypothetical protein